MAQDTLNKLAEAMISLLGRSKSGETDIQIMKNLILSAINAGELLNPKRDGENDPVIEEGEIVYLPDFRYGQDVFYSIVDIYKAAIVDAKSRTESHQEVLTVLKQASAFAGKALVSEKNPKGLQWSEKIETFFFRINASEEYDVIGKTCFEKLAPTVEGTIPDVSKARAVAEHMLSLCNLADEASKPMEMSEKVA